jgi:pyrroloquinoline quinone (PQQ) biosynthesis protein C
MDLTHRLLDHPFYRAWSHGTVTADQLSRYHRSYAEFIAAVPSFWRTVTTSLDNGGGPIGENIIREEHEHIRLWEEWGARLPACADHPGMADVVSAFRALSPSALLGALHAFEVQQPEVACTKREGLQTHYGFSAEELRYFDEHEREEEHIRYGRTLAERSANRVEFEAGWAEGARLAYASLDRFVAA